MSADDQQVGGTHYKDMADQLAQATNGRIYVDPVTGNVGIGTPAVQRTWVGLTNEELTDLFYNTNLGQQSAVSQAVALLKERNS